MEKSGLRKENVRLLTKNILYAVFLFIHYLYCPQWTQNHLSSNNPHVIDIRFIFSIYLMITMVFIVFIVVNDNNRPKFTKIEHFILNYLNLIAFQIQKKERKTID